MDNTIRIARLKLLLHNNRDQVKYSIHDTRMPVTLRFLRFFVIARSKTRPWVVGILIQLMANGSSSNDFYAKLEEQGELNEDKGRGGLEP